jgi:hypothetical protein
MRSNTHSASRPTTPAWPNKTPHHGSSVILGMPYASQWPEPTQPRGTPLTTSPCSRPVVFLPGQVSLRRSDHSSERELFVVVLPPLRVEDLDSTRANTRLEACRWFRYPDLPAPISLRHCLTSISTASAATGLTRRAGLA